jgi:RNA polymerase sigma-70 factor (ECF subfamily)
MAEQWFGEVTVLLEAARAGSASAGDQVFLLLKEELHRLATRAMNRERKDHTLEPTALLHEAWLQLFRPQALSQVPDRKYLLGAAARAMRQILVDHARRRHAEKRGKGRRRVALDAVLDHCEKQAVDVTAVHDALNLLATWNERQSNVVTLRFFGGFTVEQIAEQLQVSVGTVERDYRIARAWLRDHLERPETG